MHISINQTEKAISERLCVRSAAMSLIIIHVTPAVMYCKWVPHQALLLHYCHEATASLPQNSKVWPCCCCIDKSFCTAIQGQYALEQVCQTVGVYCHILISQERASDPLLSRKRCRQTAQCLKSSELSQPLLHSAMLLLHSYSMTNTALAHSTA